MYNIISNQWKKIITDILPPARKNACMSFYYPLLLIYGGENGSGYLDDMWVFNYERLNFQEIVPSITIPAMTEHKCLFSEVGELYIFSGKVSAFELNEYVYTSVGLSTWQEPMPAPQELQISSAGTVIMSDFLVMIGGSGINSAVSEVSLVFFSNANACVVDYLPVNVTYHAVAHTGRSIYVFGGALAIGNTFFDSVGTSNFYNITADYLDCSRGFYGDSCKMCGPGSYSSALNSENCSFCGPGTYSDSYGMGYPSQCTPCAYGSYSNLTGSRLCRDCGNPSDCPVGSTAPSHQDYIEYLTEIQPSAFDKGEIQSANAVYTFQLAVLGVGIFAWVLYFFVNRKNFYDRFDIFEKKHIRKYYEEPKSTSFGGVMTLTFFLAASLFIVSPAIIYNISNIVETKTFVPVFTQQNTIFTSDLIYINIKLSNYGGGCGDQNNTCLSRIDARSVGIHGTISNFSCKGQARTCTISFNCTSCTLDLASGVYLTVSDILAYTTSIQMEVISTSSIPKSSLSALSFSVTSPQNEVFNGLSPTAFTVSMIPSVKYM